MKETKPIFIIKASMKVSQQECRLIKNTAQEVLTEYTVIIMRGDPVVFENLQFELIQPNENQSQTPAQVV